MICTTWMDEILLWLTVKQYRWWWLGCWNSETKRVFHEAKCEEQWWWSHSGTVRQRKEDDGGWWACRGYRGIFLAGRIWNPTFLRAPLEDCQVPALRFSGLAASHERSDESVGARWPFWRKWPKIWLTLILVYKSAMPHRGPLTVLILLTLLEQCHHGRHSMIPLLGHQSMIPLFVTTTCPWLPTARSASPHYGFLVN